MTDTLFTNVRVFDGGGEAPFTGDVLVQGNKISRVVKAGFGQSSAPVLGARIIDGAGAFLMPGMIEAHTHFSWNDQPTLDAIQRMPPEEHILWCAEVAKKYLDMGWTSCVGAAAAKPRLDVVIRNAINDGTIVGPRYLAASQEITVPGGLGDTTAPHLPQHEFAFGAIVSGAEEMRRCVRMFAKYGVDSIKINLSGESITGMPSEMSQFTSEEVRVCVEESKAWGKRVSAHARSSWAVKECIKQGIEVIYHASFTDEEALDMLEANKLQHHVAPGLAWLINTCHHASQWGLTPEVTRKMGYHRELEAAIESMKAMRRRLVEKAEGIIRESVKPMERIEGIKILHVDGLGGSGGGGDGVNGNGNFADGIVNSALRFRAQAPLVDQLLREIGIEGGDIQNLVGGVSGANAGLPLTAPKE